MGRDARVILYLDLDLESLLLLLQVPDDAAPDGNEEHPAALAVVLSGMGRDGCSGAAAIHARGGTVFAQDQASSAVWGMPRQVIELGIVSEVGTPKQIAARARALARRTVTR